VEQGFLIAMFIFLDPEITDEDVNILPRNYIQVFSQVEGHGE
jgi:hypothetical protein